VPRLPSQADKVHSICFVETPEEAAEISVFWEETDSNARSTVVVALTLEAQVVLMRNDIPHESTLQLFGREEHEEALLSVSRMLEQIGEQIDLRLDGGVIRETYHDAAMFKIQYYLNHMAMTLGVVEAALGLYGPVEVLLPDGHWTLSDKPDLVIQSNERWATRVVAEFCAVNRIRTREVGKVASKQINTARHRPRRILGGRALRVAEEGLVRYLRRSSCVLYSGSFDGFKALASQMHGRDRRLILIDDSSRSWRGVFVNWARALAGRAVVVPAGRPSRKDPDWIKDHEQAIAEKVESTRLPTKGIEHKGVSFWHVYGEKVAQHCLPALRQMATKILRQLRTASALPLTHVVVTSAREATYGLCEYAKSFGIPSVMVSHGTAIAPKNPLEEIENAHIGCGLQLSPVISAGGLQSPLEEEHIQHYGTSGRMYRVGPILFGDRDVGGRLRARPARKRRDEVTIVMASTCKNNATYRFWAMETPDEYIKSCRDLIHAVNELENVRLVIRLHQKLKLSVDDLLTLMPASDRVTLDRHGSFKDCLRQADLVVSFSSTTIEEGLQNRVPLLLYDPWQRYQHCSGSVVVDPSDLRPGTVHYLNRRDQLRATLESIVATQLRKTPDPKDFFPYCYGEEAIGFEGLLDATTEDVHKGAVVGREPSSNLERKFLPSGPLSARPVGAGKPGPRPAQVSQARSSGINAPYTPALLSGTHLRRGPT
jgi:hypothetical protein